VIKDGKFVCFDEISCFKRLFFKNALFPLVLAFSFPFFYLTLTLAPLQQKKKRPFDHALLVIF